MPGPQGCRPPSLANVTVGCFLPAASLVLFHAHIPLGDLRITSHLRVIHRWLRSQVDLVQQFVVWPLPGHLQCRGRPEQTHPRDSLSLFRSQPSGAFLALPVARQQILSVLSLPLYSRPPERVFQDQKNIIWAPWRRSAIETASLICIYMFK